MNWFEGSIAEAIAKCKAKRAIFVVFVEGKCKRTRKLTKLINKDRIRKKLESEHFVAIKIESDSPTYIQFAAIYKIVPVPSIYFIGKLGAALKIIDTSVGSAVEMESKINEVLAAAGLSSLPMAVSEAGPGVENQEPVTLSTPDVTSQASTSHQLGNCSSDSIEKDTSPQSSNSHQLGNCSSDSIEKDVSPHSSSSNQLENCNSDTMEKAASPESSISNQLGTCSSDTIEKDPIPQSGTRNRLRRCGTYIIQNDTSPRSASNYQLENCNADTIEKDESPESSISNQLENCNSDTIGKDVSPHSSSSNQLENCNSETIGKDVSPHSLSSNQLENCNSDTMEKAASPESSISNQLGNCSSETMEKDASPECSISKQLGNCSSETMEKDASPHASHLEVSTKLEESQIEDGDLRNEQKLSELQLNMNGDKLEKDTAFTTNQLNAAITECMSEKSTDISTNCVESETTRIQFQLGTGEKCMHTFNCQDTLGTVRNYVCTSLLPETDIKEFILATPYPKKNLTVEHDKQTLLQLKLFPTAVILVICLEATAYPSPPNPTAITPHSGGLLNVLTRMTIQIISPVIAIFRYLRSIVIGRNVRKDDKTVNNRKTYDRRNIKLPQLCDGSSDEASFVTDNSRKVSSKRFKRYRSNNIHSLTNNQ